MSRASDEKAVAADDGQRLDKWLWYARVVKSRTIAASLVTGGKVRINRERAAKPSHAVRIGDVLTVSAHARVRVLRVVARGTRRGPVSEARQLFEDLTPLWRADIGPDRGAERDPGSGRPTKRDRRVLDRLKGEPG